MIAREPEEPLHTPEELQFLPNLAHWIEGAIIGLVAIIALIQAFGFLNSGLARFLWPGLIFLAGLFLPPYILLHHGLARVGIVWRYTSRPNGSLFERYGENVRAVGEVD